MHIVGLIVAPINAADRTLSNQTICTKQLGNCSGLMIIVAKACSDFITSDDIVQNPSAELGGRLAFRTATAGLLCIHLPTAVGDLKPRDLPEFKWVNAVLGNLKTTLAGAFHALKCSKYGEHYLAAFSTVSIVASTFAASSQDSLSMSCGRNQTRSRASGLMLKHVSNQDWLCSC